MLDAFNQPLSGIEVVIPTLDLTATTNSDGGYGFGFGESADYHLPSGLHRAVINPDLKNRIFGSIERDISVEEGRLNNAGITMIPILNPEVPFRRIYSGDEQVVLMGGDLLLNLKDTTLSFPDKKDYGDIHTEFLELGQFGYMPVLSSVPHWIYAVNPAGIVTSGNIGITLTMPAIKNSHDYVSKIGTWVVLVGLDPDSLKIAPVGVGEVSRQTNQVVSTGKINLKRLDCIGYATAASEEKQAILKRFVEGTIGLHEMIGELETQN